MFNISLYVWNNFMCYIYIYIIKKICKIHSRKNIKNHITYEQRIIKNQRYILYIILQLILKLKAFERHWKNKYCLHVFNYKGSKITNFRKSFMTACKNAGFKDLHIHDLRHVFASKMVMSGTSLYIKGELLGHRTTQMTKRYSHLVPEALNKAVDDVWK